MYTQVNLSFSVFSYTSYYLTTLYQSIFDHGLPYQNGWTTSKGDNGKVEIDNFPNTPYP